MEKNLIPDLITYAETLPNGSMLKEIAYTTIKELSKENPFGRDVKRPDHNRDGFIHKQSGRMFSSLRVASRFFGIRYDYVVKDINSGMFQFGIYVC